MCGRIEVDKSIVDKGVYATQKVRFNALNNFDQRPTQSVACLHHHHGNVEQVNSHWGIKPNWAHHVIINAQSETVALKKTFSSAYALHRCVVPCSAWFEWTGDIGQKTKYRFTPNNNDVLFMAGILFPDKQRSYALVTLTCQADAYCGSYHQRMPLLIDASKVRDWLALPHPAHELDNFHDLHALSACRQ